MRPRRGPRSRLVGRRSDIAESDAALDVLAGENGLVVPANEDANVAWQFRRHSGRCQIAVARNQNAMKCRLGELEASCGSGRGDEVALTIGIEAPSSWLAVLRESKVEPDARRVWGIVGLSACSVSLFVRSLR